MRERTIRRILILTKFRFIGDTLVAVPLIRAVRARWPEAHITLLTGTNANILLQNNPYLDEIVEYDPHKRDRGLRLFFSLLRRLRRRRFDLSLTLNRSFHSALTPWMAGAPLRAGSRAEGRSFLFTHRLDYDTDKSEIECYLDVLRAVEPDVSSDPSLELWLTEDERQQAAQHLQAVFDEDRSRVRLLGLQPGASNLSKQWDATCFAQAADALLFAHPDLRLVLLGGKEERVTAEAMLARMAPENRRRAANFVGELDLRASLAMVSQADVFLGNDTALRHAAVALHVPSVALFGPTNPRKWGNYGPPHQNLISPDGAMAGIETKDVIEATDALLTSSAGAYAV